MENNYTDTDMFETEPTEDIEKLKKLKTELNALYGKNSKESDLYEI